jgi:4-aminobutyrate aminotransferase / (S)-3-amino-2-methylpropionate transaminase / 5-aminovalerate transaminase
MNTPRPGDQRPHLVTEIPGPMSRALRTREDAHIAPGLQSYAVTSGVVVDHAVGSAVTDVDGNVLLDFVGGIGVNSFGHSHPAIVSAVQKQVERAAVGSFTSKARVDLVERLAQHAPAPGVHRVQLYSTGSEAVESALRLAKSHTGKYEFVSFWGGFHGKTLGSLSLMGSAFKEDLGPFAPGSHVVPYADCYRCPLGLAFPSCGVACAEVARKQVKMQSTGAVAAVIVEPIQGTAGNVIPPDEFLRAVRSIADDLDALLIVDEMITGFGRTGTYWGLEHAAVRPDIVTLGKAFGGGYPLSGVLTTDVIASAKPWSVPSGSSSSYGGNPLASAAGAAALKALDDERLVERSRTVGAAMLRELAPFVDDYPFVGEVRGRGLLAAIELVRSKRTKEPLSAGAARRIYDACVTRGLLAMTYAPRVRLQPPLTIDAATASNGVAILREVFDLAKREAWWEQP